MTCDGESGRLSFDEKNQLVVEKDGKSTAYAMNISTKKLYGDEPAESTVLGLYYTGEDESDLPNLLPILEDWKTDYAWDSWYYRIPFRHRSPMKRKLSHARPKRTDGGARWEALIMKSRGAINDRSRRRLWTFSFLPRRRCTARFT